MRLLGSNLWSAICTINEGESLVGVIFVIVQACYEVVHANVSMNNTLPTLKRL